MAYKYLNVRYADLVVVQSMVANVRSWHITSPIAQARREGFGLGSHQRKSGLR